MDEKKISCSSCSDAWFGFGGFACYYATPMAVDDADMYRSYYERTPAPHNCPRRDVKGSEQKFLDYIVNLLAALFGMDPAEINFPDDERL